MIYFSNTMKRNLLIAGSVFAVIAAIGTTYYLLMDSNECLASPIEPDETELKGYYVKLPDGRVEEWFDTPDSVSEIPGAIRHFSDSEGERGFYKKYSTFKGRPFYYNRRHGFYVRLPEGIGLYQSGESEMGAHFNEFYNRDTTMVICTDAYYYDVMLDDEENPNYVDSLKLREKDLINRMGPHTLRYVADDIWVAQGRIDHSNPDNPPADRFIHKWLLKKDIEGRECEFFATIYYNDSLQYRYPEFEKLINLFPDKPF